MIEYLEHELVDGPLDALDETGQLLVFVGGDAGGNDGARNTARPSESGLRLNEHIGDVLTRGVSAPLLGTFENASHTFSSQRSGRCSRISRGSVSAVRTMISAIPRFRVFVAGNGPNQPDDRE